ncbi:hypothetical protein ACS0TY_006831 [Phlomoides rotata]
MDAAIYRDGTSGLSFMEKGEVLLVGTKRLVAGGSSTLMETMSLQYGLQSESYVMSLIDDIRSLAAITNCMEFRNVGRMAIRAADALAHLGKESGFE